MHNDADLIKNISDLISQAISSVYSSSIKVRLREQFNNTRKTNVYQLVEFYEKVLMRYSQFVDVNILDEINEKIDEFNTKNNVSSSTEETQLIEEKNQNEAQEKTYEGDIRYIIDLEKYKQFVIDRINNMVITEQQKNEFIQKVGTATRIGEVRDVLSDARKVRDDALNNDLVGNNKQIIQYSGPEQKMELPKPVKVTSQKPSWWNRNWKKVLIAAGIATTAILVAPYICYPLMQLNSVAWHQIPALRGVLHGVNNALASIGNFSPFAHFSYAALTGEWSLNGAVFNQMAVSGSMLQAIIGISFDVGATATLAALAKRGYKNLSASIKNYKTEIDNERKNTKVNEKTSKVDNIKNAYDNLKQQVKNNKENKNNKRKNGFVNNFKDKFNNIKQKVSENINHDLKYYKESTIEYLRTTSMTEELFDEISNKVNNAHSEEEVNKILDQYIEKIDVKVDNKNVDSLEEYRTKSINHIQKMKIDKDELNKIINDISNAKTKQEITNIMNNSSIVIAELKKNYVKKIANLLNNGIDNTTAQMIVASIRQCNTLKALQKCMEESDRLIEHVMNMNEEEMNKKRAA